MFFKLLTIYFAYSFCESHRHELFLHHLDKLLLIIIPTSILVVVEGVAEWDGIPSVPVRSEHFL